MIARGAELSWVVDREESRGPSQWVAKTRLELRVPGGSAARQGSKAPLSGSMASERGGDGGGFARDRQEAFRQGQEERLCRMPATRYIV